MNEQKLESAEVSNIGAKPLGPRYEAAMGMWSVHVLKTRPAREATVVKALTSYVESLRPSLMVCVIAAYLSISSFKVELHFKHRISLTSY